MHTPFFPAFRPRLATLGRRVQHLRQQSLCHLELLLGPLLPPGLLAQADEGANSRVRVGVAAAGQKMAGLWHGLRPKVIDGTTVSAPDKRKNQRAYPQSRSQKPGCGFPLIRLVGVFSLSTGVLLDYVKGNKHQHELRLLWKMLDQFKPGDLAVADRGFCS